MERRTLPESETPQPRGVPITALAGMPPVLQARLAARREQTLQAAGGDLHAAARSGLRGGGGPLPYVERIQAAFGRHDVSGVPAHVGGPAEGACEAIGARAYASDGQVAFREAPDLHTAAHEAAHLVQQREGVQLAGGVGRAGDPYEQHADQVADAVVSGRSAEGVLDAMAPGVGTARAAGQKEESKEVAEPAGRKCVNSDPNDPGARVFEFNNAQTELDKTGDLISNAIDESTEVANGLTLLVEEHAKAEKLQQDSQSETSARLEAMAKKESDVGKAIGDVIEYVGHFAAFAKGVVEGFSNPLGLVEAAGEAVQGAKVFDDTAEKLQERASAAIAALDARLSALEKRIGVVVRVQTGAIAARIKRNLDDVKTQQTAATQVLANYAHRRADFCPASLPANLPKLNLTKLTDGTAKITKLSDKFEVLGTRVKAFEYAGAEMAKDQPFRKLFDVLRDSDKAVLADIRVSLFYTKHVSVQWNADGWLRGQTTYPNQGHNTQCGIMVGPKARRALEKEVATEYLDRLTHYGKGEGEALVTLGAKADRTWVLRVGSKTQNTELPSEPWWWNNWWDYDYFWHQGVGLDYLRMMGPECKGLKVEDPHGPVTLPRNEIRLANR